jgi:hypothetical protein
MSNEFPPSPDNEQAEPQPPKPERGRARERYERRKAQATPSSQRSSAPRRQIQVPERFSVPALNFLSSGRVLIGLVGALALIVIVVYVLGRIRNADLVTQPNAIWLGTEWTYDEYTPEALTALVAKLRDQKIGTAYAWVSYLQWDKTWRATDKFENVKAFVKAFKAAYPESLLYGWVSLPTTDADNLPRLSDVTLQQQVAAFSKEVMDEFGFDGVFLDAEPVWDGDQDFLVLLRTIRTSIGTETLLSAAIPPDWSPSNANIPVPALMEPGTEWEKEYKQSVALLVDEMVVMVYNSTLATPADYSQWVAYQLKSFALAVAELNTPTDLLIGIPTYDAEPPENPAHDPLVENVDSAVAGVRMGIEQAGDAARYFKGLAIYAEWTTDDAEWADFKQTWLQSQ